jgi:cell division protein FtsN
VAAFTVSAEIPGRGVWYRVLIGGFASSAQAIQTREDLRAKGVIAEAIVLSLPFVVEVSLATAEAAAEAEALTRRSGYLPIRSGSTRSLRVGAFRTANEAEQLAGQLRAAGLSPRVIQR